MTPQEIRGLVRNAYEFCYLPYRVWHELVGGSYNIALNGGKVASAIDICDTDADIHKALDFAYCLGLIRTGQHPSAYSTAYLLWMLDVHHPSGRFTNYLLDRDNHDGIWFKVEATRKCYVLGHGDGNYWLYEVSNMNLSQANAALGRTDRYPLVAHNIAYLR